MLRFSLKNVLTVEILTIKNKKLKDLLHGLEYPARAVLHDPFDAPPISVKLALIYSALSLLIISRWSLFWTLRFSLVFCVDLREEKTLDFNLPVKLRTLQGKRLR